ncbi:MAG: efflux RND transporter periplasmic adaptor subunit, partial [Acidobacteriota bacterium]|nr:efflux RND transporter periplasmic adaptor subunit [Acidobacteriota bacterium]
MSKDLKPKQRLGQQPSRKRKIITWSVLLLACASGLFAAYHYGTNTTKVDVPVAKARLGDFIIGVRTRGEVRSVRSIVLTAPQVPDPRIVHLAESGKPVKTGDVIVEFDAAQQEQNYLEKNTSVRTADSEIVQLKASQQITKELDSMNLMTSQYNVERAKLEASKAEVLSDIEGAKNRIDVGVSEGDLSQVKTTIDSHKTVQDADRAKGYLSKMVLRAPNDGIVNILPNFRSSGSFGSSPPPFKEGDRAWTGAAIAEIPDLSQMRLDLKLEEVDRGKIKLGQKIRVRVDAIPDKEFTATLDWISPIAAVIWKGMGLTEKLFPARATLAKLDPRLRPGMTGSAEIVIENYSNVLLIPARASFLSNGKPAVYVQKGQDFQIRQIEVGKRNESDIMIAKGL